VFPVPSWSVMASKEDAENSICDVNTNLWECLGSDRDWGLVSMMDKEEERRMDSIKRLLTRTQLLVVSAGRTKNLPADFKLSNTFWHGRRCFTQKSERNEELVVLIQGDLDTTGNIFDAVIAKVSKDSQIDRQGKSKPNQLKVDLLLVSSLATTGDILELGTDKDTTELLHTVVQSENAIQSKATLMRMLVTSDSSSSWLSEHSELLCSFHQFVFVPLYNKGVGCEHRQHSGLARHLQGMMEGEAAQEVTCTHLR